MEKIAEKEIEKNPIDFIKRESFQVGGTEEFYSFAGDDDQLPGGHRNGGKIEEEDDEEDSPNDDDDEEENLIDPAEERYEDNEYHEEEKAVAGRLDPYSVPDDQSQLQVVTNLNQSVGARQKLGASFYF